MTGTTGETVFGNCQLCGNEMMLNGATGTVRRTCRCPYIDRNEMVFPNLVDSNTGGVIRRTLPDDFQ